MDGSGQPSRRRFAKTGSTWGWAVHVMGGLGGEEQVRSLGEGGQARTAADGARGRRGEQGGKLTQLGAGMTDGSGDGIEGPAGESGLKAERRGMRLLGFLPLILGGRAAAGMILKVERLARTGEGVSLGVDQAFDFEDQFDIATPVEALAGSALIGLELGELRLPKAQDIGFQAANPCDVADLEVEAVGDGGRLGSVLAGKQSGHRSIERGPLTTWGKPLSRRSIGHGLHYLFSKIGNRGNLCGSNVWKRARKQLRAAGLARSGAGDRATGRGVLGRGAEILGRPGGGFFECSGGVKRPVGVAEEFACEEDKIGLAVGHNGVGLDGIGDHADGGGGEFGFAADAGGKGDLKAGANGDFGVGDLTAGGDIDEIDAAIAEEMGELDGVVDGPAIFRPVGGGDADEKGQMLGPDGADGVDDFEKQADAILETAAVGIGAVVGEGREELVEQVAVGGVDLDEVKAGGKGAAGGKAKGLNGGVDTGVIEGLGNGIGG